VQHRHHLTLVRTAQREQMTAAATRLFPERDGQIKGALAYRQPWQADAWDYYDDTAEIGRSADFVSDAMSRVRWYPGVRLEPDGPVMPLDAADENDVPLVNERDRREVEDAFRRLGGGSMQSIAGLFGAASLQFFVPGEGYLLGYTPDEDPVDPGAVLNPEGEVWQVVAAERLEVEERRGGDRVKLNPWKPRQSGVSYSPQTGGKPVTLPEDTFVVRFWQRHPRDGELARSAVRRVLMECEELRIKLYAIRAQELQRMNAGIFVVPATASHRAMNEGSSTIPQSQLAAEIVNHIITPIKDPGSAAAAAPYVLELDTLSDGVKPEWIVPPQVPKRDLEERDELSRRIVMALPVPTESILGLGQEANYANARIVTEQQWIMYLAPHADLLGESFSIGYLRREVAARGVMNPERFAIGADGTDLYGKPNPQESVSEAHERIVVSDAYYREKLGIPQEAAPDDEEIARRLEIERRRNGSASEPVPEVDDDSIDPNAEEPQPLTAAARTGQAGRVSKRLARIEGDLRAKVHAYLAALVERAVEKAGAKTRTNARRNQELTAAIGQVANRLVCAQLGPAMVAALDIDDEELLTGVLVSGEAQVMAWMRQAQDEALRLAERSGLAAGDIEAFQARQADDRAAAWGLLLAALVSVSRVRLFDPDPIAPDVGEFDASPLPMAPIAAGLARAGGATGNVVTVPYAGTRIPAAIEGPDGQPEPGGATTGPTEREALSSAGMALVSWTWETGTPERPFEPHQNLDGLEFRSFFDDALSNPADWPPHPYFFAGDHPGCQCQQVPTFEETP
jgi:hypothetical protein